jgi:hypothetical protein
MRDGNPIVRFPNVAIALSSVGAPLRLDPVTQRGSEFTVSLPVCMANSIDTS